MESGVEPWLLMHFLRIVCSQKAFRLCALKKFPQFNLQLFYITSCFRLSVDEWVPLAKTKTNQGHFTHSLSAYSDLQVQKN